jgi:hypothetical protein
MAPEQARGDKDVDARADIYSIGGVLYRMLTGRMPYEGENSYATMEKQARGDAFPHPRELRPDIPKAIEDIVLKCLERRRDERPSSMRDVAQPLADALPNGREMLRLLAPRLRHNVPTGPTAPTLTGAQAHSLWNDAPPPRPRTLPLAALVVASALVGGGSDELIHRIADHKSREAIAAIGGSDNTTPALLPPGHDAGISADAASVAVVPADAATVSAAPRDAAPAPPTPKPPPTPAVAVRVGSNAPSHNDHPRPHVEATPTATTGWLIVRVTPTSVHADVYVDDDPEPVGSTPVRKLLPVGKHHVKISGNSKTEETDVTVLPSKEVVIQRPW